MLALEGIRILDLTWLLPYTTLLADFGAEVIKVEEPTRGDYARWNPPMVGGLSQYFLSLHRNKKSLTLNLKTEKGKEIFYRLVEKSDVIIESFRPGVTKRLGVDYETVKKFNPKIIYCSVSGYGQDSPYKDLPGHDINYVSIAGILGLTRRPGEPPTIPGVQIADLGGGVLMATASILIALIAREKTGKGQYIDIAMTDGAISWLTIPSAFYFAEGEKFDVEKIPVVGYPPCYNVYETKDGKYISIGCLEERFWRNLCVSLGREDLINYQFANGEKGKEVKNILQKIFKTKTRDEWFKELSKVDVCVGPVYNLDETFNDPHTLKREMVVEFEHPKAGKIKLLGIPPKFSETPGKIRSPAPELGEHTREILKNLLGFNDKDIDKLKEDGVI